MARIKTNKRRYLIEDCITEYIEDCRIRNLSERTIFEYNNHLTSFLYVFNGNYLNEIPNKLNEYLNDLPNHHDYNITSYNNHSRFINCWLKWCSKEYDIDLPRLPYKKADKKLQHVPTKEEVRRLIQTPDIEEISYSRLSAWVSIVIITGTGLRVSSITGIKKEDINFKESTLFIRKIKTRQQMILPMSAKLKKALKFYLDVTDNQSEYLITNQYTDEPLQAKVMSNNVRRYGEWLGIKISCHSLRRFFACENIRNGVPLIQLSRLLGHSSVQMTEIYLQSLTVNDFETKYTNPLERL